ncbi:MAG: hypothetical protein K2Y27_32760 [Xanthobacteraceae bacterium]|nr:hypothetical protein [Xanthobacteraceae bacterium]
MGIVRTVLATTVAASLLGPATDFVAPAQGKERKAARTKVYVTKRWRGYGFLPGYRPWVNGLDRNGRPLKFARAEPRYFDFYGNVYYGWGYPGFYRGRWNGGSFGPCWAYTPIGMMPTCGP